MDEDVRRRYLAAMGIERWELRQSAAPESATRAPSAPPPPDPVPVAAPQAIPEEDRGVAWEALREQVTGCVACDLHRTRTQTVFGVGDPKARLMLIGEAPGADEDRQGEPFVGRAGRLLNEMLAAAGLRREQVYIANILKCRPPNNRDPRSEEVDLCRGFLARQVELVQPALILALGRIAAQNLLRSQASLARSRGDLHPSGVGQVPVLVTYHPAYLLRTPKDKGKAWQDLCRARRVLAEAEEGR